MDEANTTQKRKGKNQGKKNKTKHLKGPERDRELNKNGAYRPKNTRKLRWKSLGWKTMIVCKGRFKNINENL